KNRVLQRVLEQSEILESAFGESTTIRGRHDEVEKGTGDRGFILFRPHRCTTSTKHAWRTQGQPAQPASRRHANRTRHRLAALDAVNCLHRHFHWRLRRHAVLRRLSPEVKRGSTGKIPRKCSYRGRLDRHTLHYRHRHGTPGHPYGRGH